MYKTTEMQALVARAFWVYCSQLFSLPYEYDHGEIGGTDSTSLVPFFFLPYDASITKPEATKQRIYCLFYTGTEDGEEGVGVGVGEAGGDIDFFTTNHGTR